MIRPVAPARPVARLVLEDAGLRRADGSGWTLRHISLSPEPGELTFLRELTPGLLAPLLDLLGGIRAPDEGLATIDGEDWWSMPTDSACARRGDINWAFRTPVWISSLSIAEGITLEERYHTGRPEHELETEAEALCRRFGLPGLPLHRPVESTPDERRRAEFARAFLGEPAAVFLEDPLSGAPRDVVRPLGDAIARVLHRGAAVVFGLPARAPVPPLPPAVRTRELLFSPTGRVPTRAD